MPILQEYMRANGHNCTDEELENIYSSLKAVGYESPAADFEAPDPADYGPWVPGIPVLVGGLLEKAGLVVRREDRLYDMFRGRVMFPIISAQGRVLGFDGSVVPADFGSKFTCSVVCNQDLVGRIWNDRPKQQFSEIFELPLQYTGQSAADKIERIRAELETYAKDGENYLYILNSLDDIAWIFNLRANDVEDNPVQFAYAAISRDNVMLFTGAKIPSQVQKELEEKTGFVHGTYSRTCLAMEGYDLILMDCARISYDTWCYYKDRGSKVLHLSNPSTHMKAVKNDTEIRCLKEALVKDSAVVVNFMYWLKQNIETMVAKTICAQVLINKKTPEYQQRGMLEESALNAQVEKLKAENDRGNQNDQETGA